VGLGRALGRIGIAQAGAALEEAIAANGDALWHRAFRPVGLVGQHHARPGRIREDIVLHQPVTGAEQAAIPPVSVHVIAADLKTGAASIQVVSMWMPSQPWANTALPWPRAR